VSAAATARPTPIGSAAAGAPPPPDGTATPRDDTGTMRDHLATPPPCASTARDGTATPQITAVARRVVALLHEVEAGLRPARVVAPLLAPHLRGPLVRRGRAGGPVPHVRRLIVTAGGTDAWDVVAIRSHAGRVSALGLRLQRVAGRTWQVVDLAAPGAPLGCELTAARHPGPARVRSDDRVA
jgi:hypothetical protein